MLIAFLSISNRNNVLIGIFYFQVDLENLSKGTTNIEETLKNFSEEEIDSQMAIIKVSSNVKK